MLREWRKKFGLTQEEAASILGVHKSTWHRWESQTREPHPMVLKFIHHLDEPVLPEQNYGKRRLAKEAKKKSLENI